MQLYLPSRINPGVSPGAIALDSLVSRLYDQSNIRGPYRYPASPYGRGVAGLGFDYNDLLAESGRESCDPKDSACVGRNEQRQVVVEDLWINQFMTHADTANLPAPHITVNTDNSAAATSAFMNNQPLTSESVTFQGGPTYTDYSLERAQAPAASVKPNQSVPPTTPLVPMNTGFQNTAAALVQQHAAADPAVTPPADSKILGMDQKTFLLVAAAGAAALFFAGGRR